MRYVLMLLMLVGVGCAKKIVINTEDLVERQLLREEILKRDSRIIDLQQRNEALGKQIEKSKATTEPTRFFNPETKQEITEEEYKEYLKGLK